MNSPATFQAAAKVLVSCPKCSGRGRINAFAHVVGGRCFDCAGSGKLKVDALTAAELAATKVRGLIYTASISMDRAFGNRMDIAHPPLARMVSDMFEIGSERALEVLTFIGEGRYWSAEDNCFNQLDSVVALGLRTHLIELGRARKAAA